MQKTNFTFEVLIHDDASADNTATIIREYKAKYPEIIKPIYQTENQYSKGVKVTSVYQFPRAKGKYIALCEGDDYWTDPYKLQKQVDFLEANKDYGLVHSAYFLRDDNNNIYQKIKTNVNHADNEIHWQIIGQELIVCTCSVLMRTDLVNMIQNEFADDYSLVPIGDTQTWFHFARLSKIGYVNEPLCVYRLSSSGVTGSVDTKKRIGFLENALKLDLYLAKTYDAPVLWVDKIKHQFSRSILIEALIARDRLRIEKYGQEIFSKKNGSLWMLTQISKIPFFKRRIINRLLVIFNK
jgi:glycosyltransferase involved in cell wall biosynthesis